VLSNDDTMRAKRYSDLQGYCDATGIKKGFVAKQLGISRFQLSGLLYPDRYPVVLTDDLVERLAELLNQRTDYVRKLYPRAA
jgi:hypothetical protein